MLLRIKVPFMLLVFVMSMISCSSDDETALSLNFQLEYDGEPLVMLQDYRYPDGKLIRFSRVSFFMSDLKVSDGTSTIDVMPVEMVNLTRSHLDLAGAQQGFTLDLGIVPMGSVERISFNIGLTPEQNASTPADYTSENPLSSSGEYWLGWESYIFAKIEGFVDLDGDDDPETPVALHLGSDPIRREIAMDVQDTDGVIRMMLDVKNVFQDASGMHDIAATPNIHHLGQLPLAQFLIDNWKDALVLRN